MFEWLIDLLDRRIETRTPCEDGYCEENDEDKNDNPGDLHDALLKGSSARCVDAEANQRERSVVERENYKPRVPSPWFETGQSRANWPPTVDNRRNSPEAALEWSQLLLPAVARGTVVWKVYYESPTRQNHEACLELFTA